MEDKIAKEIRELVDYLHEVANREPGVAGEWRLISVELASLILENDRRRIEEIEMVRGANDGWQRSNEEQREKIETLTKRNREGKWIPVTEQLPENVGSVLIVIDNSLFKNISDSVSTGYLSGNDWMLDDDMHSPSMVFEPVTHWMPFPLAPIRQMPTEAPF